MCRLDSPIFHARFWARLGREKGEPSHRSESSAFLDNLIPKIEGHFWSFFSVCDREHLPFRYLKGVSQSVKFFVLLLIIQAFNQRSVDV